MTKEISRDSKELFSLVAENVKDFAVYTKDLEGRVLSWNPGVGRLLGYAEEEWVGRHVSVIFTPEDLAQGELDKEMKTALAEGRAEDQRWHVRKDGSWFWSNGLLMLLRDDAGEPRAFAKILRDDTARKRAEEGFKFQAHVVSQLSDAVVAVDLRERVTFWNLGAERLYGVAAGDALGRPLNDAYQYRWACAGDEEAAAESLAKTGAWFGENLHVRNDGRWIHVESSVSRLEDDDGAAVGLLAVVRDITARKKAEEALRRSEERLRLTLESVTDYAILTTDTSGWIETWNVGAERMFGYPEEEAVGQHVEVIFTPEDREQGVPAAEMRRARQEGRALCERWHVGKRGARFYVSGVLAPLRDGGVLTGYAKIVRDLTERRRAEEELRRAHEELEARVRERTRELQETAGALLSEAKERAQAESRVRALLRQLVTVQEEERRRIARELHDTLGQQLAALRLSIDVVKSRAGGRSGVTDETERMQAIFDRLNSDVDFLAWELRPLVLDTLGLDAALQTFVTEWSEHFRVEADYHGFGSAAPRLPPEVETNLYRILQEALQNVHKHAGASRVSVLLERRGGRAVLIVEDNGKGYDPEEEADADGGRGMGLTNMRERAALVGGELEIESAPGAGTTIFVRVPINEPDGESVDA
ncbi:MAG TPA: PAS domain S-box protein [Pyrinomonadaceae bacterium]|jgi:PAS domain S-box-containing protein